VLNDLLKNMLDQRKDLFETFENPSKEPKVRQTWSDFGWHCGLTGFPARFYSELVPMMVRENASGKIQTITAMTDKLAILATGKSLRIAEALVGDKPAYTLLDGDQNELKFDQVECKVPSKPSEADEVETTKALKEQDEEKEEDLAGDKMSDEAPAEEEMPGEEEPGEGAQEEMPGEPEAPELVKCILGKSDETVFYIVPVKNENEEVTDIEVDDQEGMKKYLASENEIAPDEVGKFVVQAVKDLEIQDISSDVFMKYVYPMLVEEEEEEENPEEQEETPQTEKPEQHGDEGSQNAEGEAELEPRGAHESKSKKTFTVKVVNESIKKMVLTINGIRFTPTSDLVKLFVVDEKINVRGLARALIEDAMENEKLHALTNLFAQYETEKPPYEEVKKELDRLLNVFGSRQALIQALRSEDNNWQEDEDSDQPGDLDYILNILGESKKKNECSCGKGKHCSCEASTKQEEDDEVVVPGDVFVDNRSGEQCRVMKIEKSGPEPMVVIEPVDGGEERRVPALEFTSLYVRYNEDQEIEDSTEKNLGMKEDDEELEEDEGFDGSSANKPREEINVGESKYQVVFADGHKVELQSESISAAMRKAVKAYGKAIPQSVKKLGEKKIKEALDAEVTPDTITVENDKYVVTVANDRLTFHSKEEKVTPALPVPNMVASEEPETFELEVPAEMPKEEEETPEEGAAETPEEQEEEAEVGAEKHFPEEKGSKKRPFESKVIEAVADLVFLYYIIIGRMGKQAKKYTIDRSKLINWLELDDAEESIPEKEWNQFGEITGFLTCADMSLKAIIRSLKTNKLPLKIAHEEGAIGIANNAQEAQKAATDIYMELETGSFDESKVNESYSNSDIAADLKAGVPETAVVARIMKRYSDIGLEQARKIVKAVRAGEPTDWSHQKEKSTDESKTKVDLQFRSKKDNKKSKDGRKEELKALVKKLKAKKNLTPEEKKKLKQAKFFLTARESKKMHEAHDHDLWDAILQKLEGQESKWESVLDLMAQVWNGGFEQWITNGYAAREGHLVQTMLAKIGTDTAEKVAKMADQAMAYTEEDIYGDPDREGMENNEEETEAVQELEKFDDAFYAGLDDQLVKDLAAKLGVSAAVEPKPEAKK